MQRLTEQGFSFLELVMVIVILGIISVAGVSFLREELNTYFTNQNITEASWQTKAALENMVRRIHQIRSTNDISTASSTQLTFVDINNNSNTYQISGGSLLYNTNTLLTGLTNSSSFSYLDGDAQPTAVIANIRYVVITLAISQNNVTYTIRTAAFIRS